MAFRLPSLADLSKRVRDAFRTEIPGADAEIWPNNLYVVGKVVAGATFEVYLRLEWLYSQIFASTATGEHLDRHAYEIGLSRKPASYATGSVTVTGVPSEQIPAGRRFLRSDGRVFRSIETTTIPGSGTATLRIQSVEPGRIQNTSAGSVLTRETAYAELSSDATVSAGGLTGGANAESDDALRDRIVFRRRNPPMGGALHDYKIWAESVVGVRRAFAAVYQNGGRMIAVYVLGDGYGATAIPDQSLIDAVAAKMEDERPVTAVVTVTAPVAKRIDIVIQGLTPASQAVREEVERELIDLFYERATVALPGSSLTFPRSWITSAIDAAAGEERHRLVTPEDDVPLTAGQYPVLGTIQYT
jgi:uncharacterized phage protein gp47/JayE